MKKKIRFYIYLYILIGLFLNLTNSCKKDELAQLPTLSTTDVSDITPTTATCGGNISFDGGASVTSRGVCWSISSNPTITNSKTTDGTGIGIFTSSITGLLANTTYYSRAYASNSAGTVYGNEISFTTNPAITTLINVFKVINGKEIGRIKKTNDGGYVGISFYGQEDYNIIKFDSDFNIIWDKTYGGSKGDYASSIIQTNDDGYLVIGRTLSSDGNVSSNHGSSDIWICKLNADGILLWEKSYGGTNSEGVDKENSILQASNGDYFFIGYTMSNDGNITINHGGYDAWLVKINSSGEIIYEKTFGSNNNDYGKNIIKINSNYILSITSYSNNGDFNASGHWIIQINDSGGEIWKTNTSGMNHGSINSTIDNEIVVVNTSSTAFLLYRLGIDGTIKVTKTIDFVTASPKQPFANKVIQTGDNGFLIIGDLGGGNDEDAILFRTTSNFNLLYYKIYAGNDYDRSSSIIKLDNNQYIYQLITFSTNLDGINIASPEASAIIKIQEIGN